MLLEQRAVAAVLSKALATYLSVESSDIDSKLLAGDGGISFHNVEIREQELPLSISETNNQLCTLSLWGTVEEFSLEWRWASKRKDRLLEGVHVTIKGLRLLVHYRYGYGRRGRKENSRRRSSEAETAEDSKTQEDEEETNKNVFTNHLKNELEKLKKAVISNIKESRFVQQAIQDVMDSFQLHLEDVTVSMLVPFTNQQIEAGWESLHLNSRLGGREQYDATLLDLTVSDLYAKLLEGNDSMPILDPFFYRLTARRFRGTRFLDRQHGYEIIGSYLDDTKENQGIVLFYSEPTWAAIDRIKRAWCGKPIDEPDYDAEIYNGSKDDPHGIDPWPVSAKVLLWLLGESILAAFVSATKWALQSLWLLEPNNAYVDLAFKIVVGFLSIVSAIAMARADLNAHQDQDHDQRRADQETAIKNKTIVLEEEQQQPATFRLPLAFVTVHAPNNVRLDLTGISVVGQLDGSYLYAFGEQLTVQSYGLGPRALVEGIRASCVQSRWLINIDKIDALFLPSSFRLAKPLECSVIRYEEGRMTVKLRSLKGWILTGEETDETIHEPRVSELSEDDFSLSFGAMASKMKQTGKAVGGKVIQKTKAFDEKIAQLNLGVKKGIRKVRLSTIRKPQLVGLKDPTSSSQEMARNRMNAELYEYLAKLQRIAAIFETIPVGDNRENLRMYPSSFRGSEGVDFLLENNMAGTREEAGKLLQDFEVEFNLFQSVTKEYMFHDDPHCLFRFLEPSQRRNWTQEDLLSYEYIENFDREPVPSPLPFPISVLANTVVLHKPGEVDGDSFLAIRNARIFLENGKLSRSIQFTVFAGVLKTFMMALTNGRIHGLIHPDVPKLVHRLQFSVDSFLVNPEFSVEDWMEKLGFVYDSDIDDDESHEGNEDEQGYSTFQEPYSLPHCFVSQFSLILSYSGPVLKAKEALIRVDPFLGNALTTSNDLIKHFVVNVIGRSPTVLSHLRFMGVSPAQSTGIGLVMNVGAKWVPLGQYLVIGAMAVYDGVCVAIDTGKIARHDPTGHHHSGDFFRGLWALGGETARHGAQIRGKTDDDWYDENDHVKLDPWDFAVGVSHGFGGYANKNKAKFAGAYVAAAVMIGTTVAFGPLGGILAGVVAGAGTEAAVKKIEKRFGNADQDGDESIYGSVYDDIDKED